MAAATPAPRAAFPLVVMHPIRYCDTDRQGHVNNAAFATYFEVVRTHFLFVEAPALILAGFEPVLARLEIDYRAELFYPGDVALGMAVAHLGTASVRFAHGVFRDAACIAAGTCVLVQLDAATRRPAPWSAAQREILTRYALRAGGPA